MKKSKEERDLIKVPSSDVAEYDDELFKKASKTGDYLARLQLMTSNNDLVKGGKFPVNHFAIVRDQVHIDIGEAVDVLVVAWRPKALEIEEEITTVYNPDDDEFARIAAKSEDNMSCMYGPEFLLWFPENLEFLTFFMCSKSMRRESPHVKVFMRKACTLIPKEIPGRKYTWWSPIAIKPTTPLTVLPPDDKLKYEYKKFIEAEKNAPEKVKAEEATGRER
jgi:hypothetical protein